MQAPAHLQPKVVIGPPSRKRSCPELDDIMRHVDNTFFGKLCFCTKTRLPKYFSEDGEKLCSKLF